MKLFTLLLCGSAARAATYPRVYYGNTSLASRSRSSYDELTTVVLSSTDAQGSVSAISSEALVSYTTLTINEDVTVITTWCPLGSGMTKTGLQTTSQLSSETSYLTTETNTITLATTTTDSNGVERTISTTEVRTVTSTVCPVCTRHSGSSGSVFPSSSHDTHLPAESSTALQPSEERSMSSQLSASAKSSPMSSNTQSITSSRSSGEVGSSSAQITSSKASSVTSAATASSITRSVSGITHSSPS